MTLEEFIKLWDGKYLEFHGSENAKNQCVDLANRYIVDVLNLPPILWTNAIDFPSKDTTNFSFIENTPMGVPLKGDLMIFGPSPYGHISIFIKGNVDSFASFDQNYPINSPCHIQSHNYNNVLGWMRAKGNPVESCEEAEKLYTLFGVSNYEEAKAWKEREEGFLEDERAKVKFLEAKIKVLETQYAGCEAIKDQNELLLQANNELKADLTHANDISATLDQDYDLLIKENIELNAKIQKLETNALASVSLWTFIVNKLFK